MFEFVRSIGFVIIYASLTLVLGTILTTLRTNGPSDVTAPTISGAAIDYGAHDDPSEYWHYGHTIYLVLTFDEEMDTATGAGATATLTIGGVAKTATYFGWSAGELYLRYVFDGSEKGAMSFSSPLVLASGTLTDLAGNDATLTFTPPNTATFKAVMRGVTFGTNFVQGADAQKLYSKFRSVTISAAQGQLGDTTGSDANDPAFASHGMTFDANEIVKDIGSNGDFDRLCKINVPWTIYFRARVDISVSGKWSIFFAAGNPLSGGGAYFNGYTSGGNLYISSNVENTCSWDAGLSGAQWATFTFSCDGANNITAWVNGASLGAQGTSCSNPSPNKKGRIQQVEGYEAVAYIGGMPMLMRALTICNVEHSSAEVADNHALLAVLPTV